MDNPCNPYNLTPLALYAMQLGSIALFVVGVFTYRVTRAYLTRKGLW